MDISLTKLKHMVAIARAKSYSQAASDLNISQPSLSRSIEFIEKDLGFRIFTRGRRGAIPTTAGEQVIAQAEALLRSAANFRESVDLISQGRTGEVRFGLSPAIASAVLSQIVAEAVQDDAAIRITSLARSYEELEDDLVNGRIDFFISPSNVATERIGVRREEISIKETSLAVRYGHPLAKLKKVTRRDIEKYVICCPTSPRLNLPVDGQGLFICDNLQVLREVTRSTDAISIMFVSFISDDIEQKHLSLIRCDDLGLVSTYISLFTLDGKDLSPLSMRFVERLKAAVNAI